MQLSQICMLSCLLRPLPSSSSSSSSFSCVAYIRRWVRVLFGRLFVIGDVLRLWDAALATAQLDAGPKLVEWIEVGSS